MNWTGLKNNGKENWITSQLGYLAPMSEANTIFQAFQVENSLKNPRNTFISKINRSYSNGLANKAKEIPCGLSKAHGKIKVQLQPKKNAVKSLKNRQTWTEHIIKPTYGDVSTLKGGWEAFTDQMLTDLKLAVQQPSSLNHPSCFTEDARGSWPL